MQVGGTAVPGASTLHSRRRLNVLVAIVAIVVIAAVVALMVWIPPPASSGVGAQNAVSAVYDDAGNVISMRGR
jgi:ABC-type transporter Mla subunit MlaD